MNFDENFSLISEKLIDLIMHQHSLSTKISKIYLCKTILSPKRLSWIRSRKIKT